MIVVIEKMNVDKVEKVLDDVLEMSSRLRVLQEDLLNINNNIKKVNFNYLSGKISRDMFMSSRKQLNNKRKLAIDRINKMVVETLAVSKGLPEMIKKNKI